MRPFIRSAFSPLQLCTALFFAALDSVTAEDPIIVFAASGGIPPQNIEVGSNNIRDLVEQLTKRENEFEALVAVDFTASLTYLGVENSILLEFSADGRSATVTIPSANFQQTFTAEDSDLLSDDLEDFLTNEGSKTLAALRKSVNTQSPAGVTDGNPFSTTGLVARSWSKTLFDSATTVSSKPIQPSIVGLSATHAVYEAGDFTGTLSEAQLTLLFGLSENFSLISNATFNYQLIEESTILGGGGNLGLGYQFLETEKTSWSVVPYAGGMFRISEDLASGGGIFNYGLSLLSSYQVSEKFIISGHTQIAEYQGIPLNIEGFELDSEIDQQVFSLGLGLSHSVFTFLTAKANLQTHQYLQDAAVDQWLSAEAGLSFDLKNGLFCSASYALTHGKDFHSDQLAVDLGIRF